MYLLFSCLCVQMRFRYEERQEEGNVSLQKVATSFLIKCKHCSVDFWKVVIITPFEVLLPV